MWHYTKITMEKKNIEYATRIATACSKYLKKNITETDDGKITLEIDPTDTAITKVYYILEEFINKNEFLEVANIPTKTPQCLFEMLGQEYERVGNEAIQFEHDIRRFSNSTLYKQVKGELLK